MRCRVAPIRIIPIGLMTLLASTGLLGPELGRAGSAVAGECWIHTPPGHGGHRLGRKVGPYNDKLHAQRVNRMYFNGRGHVACYAAKDMLVSPLYAYGAVRMHNQTRETISFELRSGLHGSWDRVSVKPGASLWWTRRLPRNFYCRWDGSRAKGEQRRCREIAWHGFRGTPAKRYGRHWQFVQRGDLVELFPGRDVKPRQDPVARKGSRLVTVRGSGTGRAGCKDLRSSKVADGAWELVFGPKVNCVAPRLRGTWRLAWQGFVGPAAGAHRTETWKLTLQGLRGSGRFEQSIDLKLVRGRGRGQAIATTVPLHDAAGVLRFAVHVTSKGKDVELKFERLD